MKQYLALDSGGTKVLAVLYDENFRILSVCRTGSLRDNTTSRELIAKNVDDMLAGLGLRTGFVLDRVSGTIDGVLLNRLQNDGTVLSTAHCGELQLGLSAAGIFGDALLALSGTGASLFAKYNGRLDCTGGYGAAVSDAGSGYWMGREAINAAIAYDENRGEPTLLRELITAHFGGTCLRDAVFSIYSRTDISPAACVASCAPLVTKAADRGDSTAMELIVKTGRILGEQLAYLIRKNAVPAQIPVTVSGSVWRSHPALFGEFCRVILGCGEREIVIPEFEPIVGAVIQHYREKNGSFDDTARVFFRDEYSEFRFSLRSK